MHPKRVHVRLALQAGGAGPSLAGGAGGEGQRMEVSTRQAHSSNADTVCAQNGPCRTPPQTTVVGRLLWA